MAHRRRQNILGQLEETVALQRYLLSCVDHLDSHGGRGPALLRLFAPLDDDDDDDRAIGAVVNAVASLFCRTLSRRRGNERSRAAQTSMARADDWCSTPRETGGETLPTEGASIVSEVLAVEVQCGVRRLDELERTRAIALAMASALAQLHPLIPPAACPTLRACATLESAAAIDAIRAFFMMPTGLFPPCHRKLLRRLLPLFARAAHGGDLDAVATRVLPMLMRPPPRGHLSEGRQRAQLLSTVRVLVVGSASLDDAIAGAEALAVPTSSPPRVPPARMRSPPAPPLDRNVIEIKTGTVDVANGVAPRVWRPCVVKVKERDTSGAHGKAGARGSTTALTYRSISNRDDRGAAELNAGANCAVKGYGRLLVVTVERERLWLRFTSVYQMREWEDELARVLVPT